MVGDRKAGSQFRFLRILEGLLRREREQPSPRTCQAAPRHSSRSALHKVFAVNGSLLSCVTWRP